MTILSYIVGGYGYLIHFTSVTGGSLCVYVFAPPSTSIIYTEGHTNVHTKPIAIKFLLPCFSRWRNMTAITLPPCELTTSANHYT